jgi:hypothetical protein
MVTALTFQLFNHSTYQPIFAPLKSRDSEA